MNLSEALTIAWVLILIMLEYGLGDRGSIEGVDNQWFCLNPYYAGIWSRSWAVPHKC